ncbi:hypothetical protein BMETH_1715_0 [methanotrophic bacterial endosymbiont of Bathymodiolus sp.]|nr:hypothetical protein BMETH_1715_0 [methanotrophic bacterial endosymbiont of Bathymodiolus sp.]
MIVFTMKNMKILLKCFMNFNYTYSINSFLFPSYSSWPSW